MPKLPVWRHLVAVFLVAVASLFWGGCAWAADPIEVSLDLYHFSGNLSQQQRDAMLASPDWQVSASYSPLLSIPGWTASWGRCGFLSLPCLQDDDETITLPPSSIRRQGTKLSFNLPRYSPQRKFKLFFVRIRLPLTRVAGHSEIETYFYIASKEKGVDVAPVMLSDNTFLLAGTLRMKGERFNARTYCPDYENCWAGNESVTGYQFSPRHRFATYNQAYLFPGKEIEISRPLPSVLEQRKVYRAYLKAMQVDGRLVEYVEISATAVDRECFFDDVEYRIIYVDGQPIRFFSKLHNPDPTQCKATYSNMEWSDEGKVISAGGMRGEMINHGSSMTYFDWHVACPAIDPKAFQRCNMPAPSAERIQQTIAEARRVRRWFPENRPSGAK
jgi:hypothetical protein